MIQDCSGFDFLEEEGATALGWSLYWIARLMPARNIVELAPYHTSVSDGLVSSAEDIVALGKRAADIRNELLAYCPYFIGEHGAKVTSFYYAMGKEFDTGFHEVKSMDSAEAGLRWTQEPVDLLYLSARAEREGKIALVAWKKHVRAGGLIVGEVGAETLDTLAEFMGNYGDDWCFERHEELAFLWREK